jgi:hypothetical protein
MDDVNAVKALEPVLDYSIRVVGSGIEIFGVLIIVTGIMVHISPAAATHLRAGFQCLQDPDRALAPAGSGSLCRGRYHKDSRT